jgi:ABC-type bacteriocin/lantibiotic exporter with double-glycine peptidase domain
MPFGVLHVFDRVLLNQSAEALAFLIFGLAGVVLVDTVLRIARSYLIDRAAMHHDYNLEYGAVKRVIYSFGDDISETETSAALEKLNALDNHHNVHARALHLLWLDLPFVGVSLAAVWLVAGHLVWLSMALCVSLGIVFLSLSKAHKANYNRARHHETQRYGFIIEAFENIFTIKSMAMEPLVQRRFENFYISRAEVNYQAVLLNHISRAIGTTFAHISMVFMVSAGTVMMIGGSLTIGELGCSALLTGAVLHPLLRALHTQAQIQTSRILRDQPSQTYQHPIIKEQTTFPEPLPQPAQALAMEG